MSWFRKAIDRGVKQGVEKAVDDFISSGSLDKIIHEALANHPRFQFVKTMQLQMLGCDPSMDPREAWDVAVNTLNDFLREEEIKFGDPTYDWSRGGAVTLIHEMELHHWERAP